MKLCPALWISFAPAFALGLALAAACGPAPGPGRCWTSADCSRGYNCLGANEYRMGECANFSPCPRPCVSCPSGYECDHSIEACAALTWKSSFTLPLDGGQVGAMVDARAVLTQVGFLADGLVSPCWFV